jgi:hypothetical protein
MEQIAAGLANAARAEGDIHAQNSLAIAQNKAALLLSGSDLRLANAIAIGKPDEIANAQAQSMFLHQLADFIAGQQAELNISNAKVIAQQRADAIHTPALVQEQNGLAIGANDLFAADVALQAGELNAMNVAVSTQSKAAALLGNALPKLRNAQALAGVN